MKSDILRRLEDLETASKGIGRILGGESGASVPGILTAKALLAVDRAAAHLTRLLNDLRQAQPQEGDARR